MQYKVGRFTVHTGDKRVSKEFRTGCSVPDSGIYRVVHAQHRLPAEVTLIKDHAFPRCCSCSEPVYFELVRSAPTVGAGGFTVTLFELPELAA